MNETAPFMQKIYVGEAFRLPWDGKPVPYSLKSSVFCIFIRFETARFAIS